MRDVQSHLHHFIVYKQLTIYIMHNHDRNLTIPRQGYTASQLSYLFLLIYTKYNNLLKARGGGK